MWFNGFIKKCIWKINPWDKRYLRLCHKFICKTQCIFHIIYHNYMQYHLNMIYKVPIGFYRYPPWLDSQYLWWLFSRPLNGGEGMVTIMIMNIRYAIMMLKISCVGVIKFYITDKPLNEVLKCHAYFKQNNHPGFCLFVCLLECFGGIFFHLFFFRWSRCWQWDLSRNWCDVRKHSKLFVNK